MPLQNRVTPFGKIEAVSARGMFTGNRGIIHEPATRTLTRRWAGKAWLVCVCWFEGRRREVMARRSWTELFFLDEATALAAGHRPCFHCRREDADRFRHAWANASGMSAPPAAPAMDAVLHEQRLEGPRKRLHRLDGPIGTLPDGTMLASGSTALLVLHGRLLRWSHEGYAQLDRHPEVEGMLTPPATVAALRAGYRPILHPSAAVAVGRVTLPAAARSSPVRRGCFCKRHD